MEAVIFSDSIPYKELGELQDFPIETEEFGLYFSRHRAARDCVTVKIDSGGSPSNFAFGSSAKATQMIVINDSITDSFLFQPGGAAEGFTFNDNEASGQFRVKAGEVYVLNDLNLRNGRVAQSLLDQKGFHNGGAFSLSFEGPDVQARIISLFPTKASVIRIG